MKTLDKSSEPNRRLNAVKTKNHLIKTPNDMGIGVMMMRISFARLLLFNASPCDNHIADLVFLS